jgi:hypothetical protein
MKMETTHVSETSTIFIHTPGNYPKEDNIQYVPVYHTTNFYPHSFRILSPTNMEQTEGSETSAIKHHTPQNNPKYYARPSEHAKA